MLNVLQDTLNVLPALLESPQIWESLIINRRKPHTYRAFTWYKGNRIALHRFSECDENEAFYHPHPWPGAFIILKGSYRMKVGYSKDRFSKPEPVAEFIMTPNSRYAIDNPLTWHTVEPLSEVFTVMVNGVPWRNDEAHTQVKTTKGKDLQEMNDRELSEHLETFKQLII